MFINLWQQKQNAMKTLVKVSVAFIFMVAALGLQAKEFGYDAQKVATELAPIAKAEQYVVSHDADLASLQASGVLSSDVVIKAWSPDEDPLFGIPAFWWGCILGAIGILLVYVLTDGDRDQTKKALFGCLVSAGAYFVFWIIWYVIVAATSAV